MLVAVEVLYGLQQRTRAGFTTRLHVLRALAEELRRSGAASIETAGELPGPMARDKQAILNSLARQVRSALGDTSAEVMKDVWDLAAFGSRRQLSFAAISQGWLRQAAKRWASDDMPRHRGARPHARVQHVINSVTRLSAHLRATRTGIDEQVATIVFATLAVSKWIEDRTGWSIKRFACTARRYRTIEIQAGNHIIIITAADPLPGDLCEALGRIYHDPAAH